MVPNITTILQRFTGEWAMLLQPEAILTICREIGYTAWRDRVLTPVTTMQLFLLQILHGNTACRHLPHLSGIRFIAAAYCQARAKLPLHLFALLERLLFLAWIVSRVDELDARRPDALHLDDRLLVRVHPHIMRGLFRVHPHGTPLQHLACLFERFTHADPYAPSQHGEHLVTKMCVRRSVIVGRILGAQDL